MIKENNNTEEGAGKNHSYSAPVTQLLALMMAMIKFFFIL